MAKLWLLQPCEFADSKCNQNDNRNDNRNDKNDKNYCDSPLARAEVLGVVLESVHIAFVVEDMQKAPENTADTLVVKRAEKGFEKFKH